MWTADHQCHREAVTLAEVMTAVDQHDAERAPLFDGLSGATDDVVARSLIDWLQSSNRELQRLLDHLAEMLRPEPGGQR